MNVYDSTRMAEALAPDGYVPTDRVEDADMVLVNTCHIREKAAEKTFSELGRLRQLKEDRARAGRELILGVTGCVAQAEGAEIARRAPFVDLVVGPQAYHRLPAMAARARDRAKGGATLLDTEFPADSKFAHLPRGTGPAQASAFLTVQEGCDKFCAFCVVPYTRGAEYSRPAVAVIAEARDLIARGVREITLLGQNVNAYHGAGPDAHDWSLARLIMALAELDGLDRIRYTTSHPKDMTDDLYAVHAQCDKLMPYVHLPIQSGSDRVLKAMNRGYGAADYLAAIERLRVARPDVAISGDFIVGFPGESEADFAATMDLVRAVGYAQAYSFKYSVRPGTPAADASDQVAEAVKSARLEALQELLSAQQLAVTRATVGRVLPVLFDRPGRRPGQLVGRGPHMQAVHVTAGPEMIGRIEPVRIVEGLQNSLARAMAPANPEQAARWPRRIGA